MDIATIITILILVGSFVYSAVQNAKAYREQQPGKEEPNDPPEPDFERYSDPFDEEPQQPTSTTIEDTTTESQPGDGFSRKDPEPLSPYEAEGPYPRELLQRETTRTTKTANTGEEAYSRPQEQAYGREEATPYQRPSSEAYQRQQKQAYRNHKKARKQSLKMQRRLRRQQLKALDPVQAVIHTEILNRPKYLEDPKLGQQW